MSALVLSEEDKSFLVPCLMSLRTYPVSHFCSTIRRYADRQSYKALSSGEAEPEDRDDLPEDAIDRAAEEAAAAAAKHLAWQNRRSAKTEVQELEPNLKGSLLLQALLGLEQINSVILERSVFEFQREATSLM